MPGAKTPWGLFATGANASQARGRSGYRHSGATNERAVGRTVGARTHQEHATGASFRSGSQAGRPAVCHSLEARNEGQALLERKAFDENPEEFRKKAQAPVGGVDHWVYLDDWEAAKTEQRCDPGYVQTCRGYLEWWKETLKGKLGTLELAELQRPLARICATPNRIKALKSCSDTLKSSH